MGWLQHERYEAEFTSETARLGAVASGLGSQAAVPSCPEWTVRDLVTHVGTGHRWASEIIEKRLDGPLPQAAVEAPEDPAAWADWLGAGARRLTDAVRAAGPDAPVWTWQPDKTAGFWLRRMLHDELVHRFDAELAGGGPGDVAPDLAADGVSDLLACIATLAQPRFGHPIFVGLVGTGETLRLYATDTGPTGEWLVERTPAGVTWRSGPDTEANTESGTEGGTDGVTVRAPARELLLVLNRRLGPDADGVAVSGDTALFTHWLEHTRF